MVAPAAPINTATANTGDFRGNTENIHANGHSAPSESPAGAYYPASNGCQVCSNQGYGYPVGPMPPAPAPVAPAALQSRSGLPWFIAGSTLWAIAFAQLMLLPHWLATKTSDGVVGNLTGVLALVGIGAALLAVGFTRRKQNPLTD